MADTLEPKSTIFQFFLHEKSRRGIPRLEATSTSRYGFLLRKDLIQETSHSFYVFSLVLSLFLLLCCVIVSVPSFCLRILRIFVWLLLPFVVGGFCCFFLFWFVPACSCCNYVFLLQALVLVSSFAFAFAFLLLFCVFALFSRALPLRAAGFGGHLCHLFACIHCVYVWLYVYIYDYTTIYIYTHSFIHLFIFFDLKRSLALYSCALVTESGAPTVPGGARRALGAGAGDFHPRSCGATYPRREAEAGRARQGYCWTRYECSYVDMYKYIFICMYLCVYLNVGRETCR